MELGEGFVRSVERIDAELVQANRRKASARAGIDRRTADLVAAVADIDKYEQDEQKAAEAIERLLDERNAAKTIEE